MKPQAIFAACERDIGNAYSEAVKNALSEKLTLLPGFYTRDFFESYRNDGRFSQVEYIFSTWGMPALTEEEVAAWFPSLKAVFYAAGTVQAFARPFLARGARIFSAWGANAVPVAEFTVSEIILANKGFFQNLHRGDGTDWQEHDLGRPVKGNYNTDIGIIGAGMIGKLVIKMLKNYKLNVLVYDPFLPDETAAALGVRKTQTLPELFGKCRVISNHLANNPQTVGMIDKTCFDRMDHNTVFLNTGRGQQVVEADLIAALKEDPTRSAVLDVTWPEPPQPGNELYSMKNVFLTPHIAGSLGNEIQRMGEFMLQEFLAVTENRQPEYEVTAEMLKTMA